jgi:hypothetical protein
MLAQLDTVNSAAAAPGAPCAIANAVAEICIAGPGVDQPDDAQAGHRNTDAARSGSQEEGGGAWGAQQSAIGRR